MLRRDKTSWERRFVLRPSFLDAGLSPRSRCKLCEWENAVKRDAKRLSINRKHRWRRNFILWRREIPGNSELLLAWGMKWSWESSAISYHIESILHIFDQMGTYSIWWGQYRTATLNDPLVLRNKSVAEVLTTFAFEDRKKATFKFRCILWNQ